VQPLYGAIRKDTADAVKNKAPFPTILSAYHLSQHVYSTLTAELKNTGAAGL
jgi:hypothetical protein